MPCAASELEPLVASLNDEYDVLIVDSAPNDLQVITEPSQVADHADIPLAPTAQ